MSKTLMKRFFAAAICAQLFGGMNAAAQDRFVFSADGVTAGSSERELPSQGYDRVTGRVVVGE